MPPDAPMINAFFHFMQDQLSRAHNSSIQKGVFLNQIRGITILMNMNGHIQIDAQRSRAGSLLGLLLLSCL